MRDIVVESVFTNVTVEDFVKVYFSEEVNQQAAKALRLKERLLVEKKENADGTVDRRVKMSPALDLPAPIAKLIKGAPIEYFEVSTYNPKSQTVEYFIESAAGDVVDVKGKIFFIQEGKNVRRRICGQLNVKVFGLGGLIERYINKEIDRAYGEVAVMMQKAIDQKS